MHPGCGEAGEWIPRLVRPRRRGEHDEATRAEESRRRVESVRASRAASGRGRHRASGCSASSTREGGRGERRGRSAGGTRPMHSPKSRSRSSRKLGARASANAARRRRPLPLEVGKRVRPADRARGREALDAPVRMMPAALASVVHAFSLVTTTRRRWTTTRSGADSPLTWKKFGEGVGILSGAPSRGILHPRRARVGCGARALARRAR